MNKTKKEHKGKGHTDMSKIWCYNCRQYGYYAQDCPKPHDNANIAEENEQNKEFDNTMDLDNHSICKDCAMVCMDIDYEDWDKDIIMYGDQGVSTKNYYEAVYGELTKCGSKEEQYVNYNVVVCW